MRHDLSIEKVLFPTDFSDHSEEALAQAAEVADRFGAELLMLHVVPERRLDPLDWGEMPSMEELERLFEREANQRVTALQRPPRVAVRQILRRGSPAETIHAVAREEGVELIVMAARSRKGLAQWMLGSVTEDVIRGAECDVMTLRRREHGATFDSLERVLVPIDFSEHAAGALRIGHALARACGAEVQLLHVIPPTSYPAFYPPSATHAVEQDVDALLDRSRLELETAWEELEATGPKVAHSVQAVFGTPAVEILEASRKRSDLIVLGSHGRSGLERLLLGSVAERVLHRADRPVWVVKSPHSESTRRGLSREEDEDEELERALKDPASVFASPNQVLVQGDWSAEQRRQVLEQWRLDAERLASSADENMSGGEPARLREVHLALEELGA